MEANAAAAASEDSLRYATVLTEIGELYDAELAVAETLERQPDDLAALDLLAKIKHMRGELSAAIGCWAQVHTRTHPGEAALMRLSSLLQLAEQEKSNNTQFMVLGPFQLWKKPAAQLELEEVFRLFLARRPDEARERCVEIARKYAGKDPDLYKLAVLANAWIAEMSGDLDGAQRILEDLGAERGFETDDDRILALARVYERIGTPELLESAVHIYRHCDQNIQGISILGHLALLHRRLGRAEEAARYEKRFLALFRRRMHRPSFADAVAAAARRYVPLAKLAALRFSETEPPTTPTPRELAIARALVGDRAGAEEQLRAGTEALDRKYLADLAVLEGNLEKAERLYLESARSDPDDPRTVEWLLNRFEETRSKRIATAFRSNGWVAQVDSMLESGIRRAPQRPRLWRQKAALAAIVGHGQDAKTYAERAGVLERRASSTVGRSLADAVYHFVGRSKGLIHEVWAARRPAGPDRGGFLEEILGSLTPELTQAVRNTFLSVREYARAKWPHRTGDILDYNYTYKATKEDEPSGGLSAGLPSAIAFLSVFLNRPIPQDVASSGVLVADAHDVDVLRPVGEVEQKVRGAYNRNLRRVILPAGNRAELSASPMVPAAVCQEIVAYAANLDEAVVLTFGEDVWVW